MDTKRGGKEQVDGGIGIVREAINFEIKLTCETRRSLRQSHAFVTIEDEIDQYDDLLQRVLYSRFKAEQ